MSKYIIEWNKMPEKALNRKTIIMLKEMVGSLPIRSLITATYDNETFVNELIFNGVKLFSGEDGLEITSRTNQDERDYWIFDEEEMKAIRKID